MLEDSSIGRILREKKLWGYGVTFSKTEALHAEPNTGAEAATSSYSAAGGFLQYTYCVLVAKNHQKILSGCLIHEFPLTFFLMILIMVREQLCWRKVTRGCFRFIWLWLLFAIMKRCAERCALQLYHNFLNR